MVKALLLKPRHQIKVDDERHAPAALYYRKTLGTNVTEGCVGPREGLDGYRKTRNPGNLSQDRPNHNESLYAGLSTPTLGT
jgi:hypothetical protein